ncbi:MAG: ATP-binding cassette domain-containing protein [Halobacteriaceae archaeon]
MTATDYVIETEGLTKRYGSGNEGVTAVNDLDLRVKEGEIFGFLGPNGAGKSTTINMLLDFVRPTSGTANVLNLDSRTDAAKLRKRIGVLPEGFGLYPRLTGKKHLRFAINWKGADDDPERILNRVGLTQRDASRSVVDYSKGMQQRLALGMALVGNPELLILDEPSSGLDPHGIHQMQKLVREEASQGTTVFFSSHILSQVEAVCDRVGILSDGKLVATDTVEGLRKTVGAGSELELRITGSTQADISEIDGVDSVHQQDGILRVTCSNSRAKATVISTLTNSGTEIIDIKSQPASLEDVFRAYTTEEKISKEESDDDREIAEVMP